MKGVRSVENVISIRKIGKEYTILKVKPIENVTLWKRKCRRGKICA
jgi:hypothetical protein